MKEVSDAIALLTKAERQIKKAEETLAAIDDNALGEIESRARALADRTERVRQELSKKKELLGKVLLALMEPIEADMVSYKISADSRNWIRHTRPLSSSNPGGYFSVKIHSLDNDVFVGFCAHALDHIRENLPAEMLVQAGVTDAISQITSEIMAISKQLEGDPK